MNKTHSRRRWIVSAAVAALPLFALAPQGLAQYRVGADGRALDANNRVGSGGHNPSDQAARTNLPSGNEIVTGNVTGGRHFRGPIGYNDPRAFRGASAGETSDRFLRQSSGPAPDSRLAETETTFYGAGRGVAPPPGYSESAPGSGAYIPAAPAVNRSAADQRVGAVDFNTPFVLPAPGQLLLPGPIDPSAGQQYITASPLTGIRQFNANDPNFIGTVTNTQYNPATGRLDDNAIQRMREELNQAAAAANPGAAPLVEHRQVDQPRSAEEKAAAAGKGAGVGQPLQQEPIQLPGVGPAAQPVEQKPIDTAVTQTPNNLNTTQSLRQRMTDLVRPEEQSTLYAQLRQRHDQAARDRNMSDAEAARAFNAARRAQEEARAGTAATPGAPGAPGAAPGQPGAPVQPGQPAQPGQPGQPGAVAAPGAAPVPQPSGPGGGPTPGVVDYAKRNEEILKQGLPDEKEQARRKALTPVKVPSLATGVKGKGLADLLKSAEDFMKEGKFTDAIEKYEQAEQVAPNNPLTRLGRANAELGASYYASAEAHLRDVFNRNPELLSGQYDLTSMLGEQRLAVIVKDLKEISNAAKGEARPVFLLAYIAYNTGHEDNAAAYLDLADKRSGGKDAFYQLLRDNWAIPQNQPRATPPPAEPQNK